MNQVLNWAKANPITVAAIAVAIASLGVFAYVLLAAGGLKGEIQDRESKFSEVRRLTSQSVEVPPEEADGRPESIRDIAISQQVIDTMSDIFADMRQQYERVFERAESINRPNREMMVDRLFPNPDRTRDLPFTAREAYRRSFPAMLQPPRQGETAARLNAGLPPEPSRLGRELARLEEDFLRQYIGISAFGDDRDRGGNTGRTLENAQLTESQEIELREEKQDLLLDLIRRRANEIHLYAQTDPQAEGFPFVRNQELMTSDRKPSASLLWEAQLELWIMQDIASAIAQVNQVDNPDTSVVYAPVKRLLELAVVPGYVGVHTRGGLQPGLVEGGGAAPRGYGEPGAYGGYGEPGMGGPGGYQGRTAPAAESPDTEPELEGVYSPPQHSIPSDPDQQLTKAFHYTPTGRTSNALYDVRHARLRAVVDVRRLPDFIDALSHTNFMTVLEVDATNVDEFEALKRGYFYGSGDAVEVEMLIETIWLRSWTVPLMPESVRKYLAVREDRSASAARAN